jgi:hypothetical protein
MYGNATNQELDRPCSEARTIYVQGNSPDIEPEDPALETNLDMSSAPPGLDDDSVMDGASGAAVLGGAGAAAAGSTYVAAQAVSAVDSAVTYVVDQVSMNIVSTNPMLYTGLGEIANGMSISQGSYSMGGYGLMDAGGWNLTEFGFEHYGFFMDLGWRVGTSGTGIVESVVSGLSALAGIF